MDPTVAREKFGLAKQLYEAGKWPDALQVLDDLEAAFPGQWPILQARARCLISAGRGADALALLEEAVRRGSDPAALKMLADMRKTTDPKPDTQVAPHSVYKHVATVVAIGAIGLLTVYMYRDAPGDRITSTTETVSSVATDGKPVTVAGSSVSQPPEQGSIQSTGVMQVDRDSLQFWMELDHEPALDPDPDHWNTYHWFVDTDVNKNTGQSHGQIGSEYNLRVVLRNTVGDGGGFIDIIGGGGDRVPAAIVGNRVLLRVRLEQIGNPARFVYNAGSSRWDGTDFLAGDKLAFSIGASSLPDDAPARIIIDPAFDLSLGCTSVKPAVRAFDRTGAPVDIRTRRVEFYAFPDLLEAVPGGIEAMPGRAGRARVVALVDDILSINVANGMVGTLETIPASLHLQLARRPAGRVTLRALDAFGAPLPLENCKITQTNNLAGVAEVSDDGAVHALPGSADKGGGLDLYLNGEKSTNYCSVRVIPDDILIHPEVEMQGRHVSAWFPSSVEPASNSLLSTGAACQAFALPAVLDEGYRIIWNACGTILPDLGRQFVGAMYVRNGGGGCSGNPLTCDIDPHTGCNSLLSGQGIPNPGLVFHEMHHNFTASCVAVHRILVGDPFLGRTFGEGMTNFSSFYTVHTILSGAGGPALETARRYLADPACDVSMESGIKNWVHGHMQRYLNEGARYPEKFDAEVATGMFVSIALTFGWEYFPRFMSVFYPHDEDIPFYPNTQAQRVAFWFAALSAAANQDLRPYLEPFNIPWDNATYEEVLPLTTWRAAQRDKPVL